MITYFIIARTILLNVVIAVSSTVSSLFLFLCLFYFIFIAQRSHCGKLNRFYVRVRESVSVRVRVRIMDFVNFGVFPVSTQTLTPCRHFSQFFNFLALHEPDCNTNFPDTP